MSDELMNIRRLTTRERILDCVDLWNDLHPTVPIARRIAEQRVFMSAPSVAVTVWGVFPDSADELAGFVITKHLARSVTGYEVADRGWLSLLAVDPLAVDVDDAGPRLVRHALDALRDQGVERVTVGSDIRKFFPALPVAVRDCYGDVLEEVGFETGATLADLYCDTTTPSSRDRIDRHSDAPHDVTVNRVTPATEDALHEFMRREFPGRWQLQVEANCAHPGGLDDYWIVTNGDEVVAFARTGTADSTVLSACVNWVAKWGPRTCGLGPIGVAESHRGDGYGLLLIATAMAAFREAGYHHMTIDGVAPGLRPYYAKLGFDPALEFVAYRSEL
jgi:predicted N-acetyltransferase YhbS